MSTSDGVEVDKIRARYENLICEVSLQVKEEALRNITGGGIAEIFELERLQRTARSLLCDDSSVLSTNSDMCASILLRASEEKVSVQKVCTSIVQEHLALWSLIDFVMCHIEAVKLVTLSGYKSAKSEAEMLLIPAPEWPDVELLKEMYRHTPTIP